MCAHAHFARPGISFGEGTLFAGNSRREIEEQPWTVMMDALQVRDRVVW